MNILILSPFSPYPINQGGKIRIFNIIKNLSRSNSVTLVAIVDDLLQSESGPLKDLCDEVVFVERPPKLWRDRLAFLFGREPYNFIRYSSNQIKEELHRLLLKKSFDIVQIEFPMMWQYAYIFKDIPIVLDALNIEYEIVRQIKGIYKNPIRKILYVIEEKKFRRREEKAWAECSLCFAVSDRERNFIRSYLGNYDKVFTIPNGVDLEKYEYCPRDRTDKRVLFLGSMDYQPNLDSVQYFLEEIFPLVKSRITDVKLDIVGRELWKITDCFSANGVELHENVPEVLPYFRKADVLVVPLRYGAGTRTKILEAMATGLPVVTTSKGCEGLEVTNEDHLLVADSPKDIADAILTLMMDTRLTKRLVFKARHLVEEKYSWVKITQMIEEALVTLL
ncbi:MAG: glycosyltransferase family 4 protein [Nitrospinota bacterium]